MTHVEICSVTCLIILSHIVCIWLFDRFPDEENISKKEPFVEFSSNESIENSLSENVSFYWYHTIIIKGRN